MATARALKAPFAYYGGSQQIAPLVVSLLPPHDVYCEVFGGAAAVLWAKSPSKLEVYNDRESGVVNLFRVLRNARMAKRLQDLLDLTPYSREEWAECYHTWQHAPDEVEMARRWFVALEMSFGKHLDHSGWSYTKVPSANPARKFRTRASTLASFTRRLANVQIEHLDFEEILQRYDGPRVCYYCDPPYLPSVRQAGTLRYGVEMDAEDHKRLLTMLLGLQGMVILKGYASALYDETLTGWTRLSAAVICRGGNKRVSDRTECLWISPNATRRQLSLFD